MPDILRIDNKYVSLQDELKSTKAIALDNCKPKAKGVTRVHYL